MSISEGTVRRKLTDDGFSWEEIEDTLADMAEEERDRRRDEEMERDWDLREGETP